MFKKGTELFVPSYQEPIHVFLHNGGEMLAGSKDGPATTIFELLINLSDDKYPVLFGQSYYTKEDLIGYVCEQLTNKKNLIINYVGDKGYKKLWNLCLGQGLDPTIY